MEELRSAARSAPAAALHPCVVPTVACFFAVAVRVRVRPVAIEQLVCCTAIMRYGTGRVVL